jgi:hypothetical protein
MAGPWSGGRRINPVRTARVGGSIVTSADRLPEILAHQHEGVLALDAGRRVFELLNSIISRTSRTS